MSAKRKPSKKIKSVGKLVKKPRKISVKIKKSKPKKSTVKKVVKKIRSARLKPKTKKPRNFKVVKVSEPKAVDKNLVKAEGKKSAPKQNFVFSSDSLFKAKIKVVGIGGGGGSIVSEIGRTLEKATFLIADTDIRALKKRSGIKHFWFGGDLTHGLGTGVNVEMGQQAAEAVKEKFKEVFSGQDIVIFIASLGGGVGSGATQVFVDAAKQFDGITLGIFTLPFKFEGKNKSRIAMNALKDLKQLLNVSLIIPNEKIFKVINENTPIIEAFSMVNKNLAESLESLIDLIYNPGIINIDFADLKAILRGKGNQAFLNTIEESGKDRAEKICDRVFTNPLLQGHGFAADNILFNIAGSESLSMFDVEKISRHISEMNPKAKIIFGISKNPKLKSKIKTTILMTGERDSLSAPRTEILANDPIDKKHEEQISKVSQKLVEKPNKSQRKNKKYGESKKKIQIEQIPAFPESASESIEVLDSKIAAIDSELAADLGKRNIRRSGLDIKLAQEEDEKKKLEQEKEWEIPAFLRRVKYKS